MSDAATPFRYFLRVRYGECDAQKVVFNSRYGDYVDLATTEFLRCLGYGAELVNAEFDYQLVKQTLEWKGPARFDDVLELSVSPQQLGNTSFTMKIEFRLAGEEKVIATAETVYVCVDTKTLTKKGIPAELRARVTEMPGGLTVDHAGWGKGNV